MTYCKIHFFNPYIYFVVHLESPGEQNISIQSLLVLGRYIYILFGCNFQSFQFSLFPITFLPTVSVFAVELLSKDMEFQLTTFKEAEATSG